MEVEALGVGLVPYERNPTGSTQPLLPSEDTVRRYCLKSESGPFPKTECAAAIILDRPAFRAMRKKFLLFIIYSVCDILLQLPKRTKREPKI